jgi:type I restriction enzyme R subunit
MPAVARNGPEYFEVEKPAVDLLCQHFGYDYADGTSAEFAAERESPSEVILAHRLTQKLREINVDLSDAAVASAVEALRRPQATNLLDANRELHGLVSRWIVVEDRTGDRTVNRSVRFIDYDDPDRNDFLLVEQLPVKGFGPVPKRLDLVLFVNGIPLVVIECKEPGLRHGISDAIKDLTEYQHERKGVTQLFAPAHFLIALKGDDARYGTVGTELKDFAPWPEPWPMTRDGLFQSLGRNPTAQDVLLAGLLARNHLLDHVRNFVVFDERPTGTVKKVARYQQFQAVNLALERLRRQRRRGPGADQGGVIWHTQGSGKSLTMLWLAVKLRRERVLENPTVVIVTDRRDLDEQIHKTFLACGFPNPVRAERSAPRLEKAGNGPRRPSKDLRTLLSGSGGETVMTTVQKFRDDFSGPGRRHRLAPTGANVVALVDEAHRSEYGLFAATMRRWLPQAAFVAFTGTPLLKRQRSTVRVFGDYIHRYTMAQSIRDGATVPILYEARLADLHVWGKKIDPMFEAEFGDLTREQRRQIQRQYAQERDIGEAADRIATIALDILEHYQTVIEPNGFKAQVAACSQLAAARYFRALDGFPHLHGRVALLISEPPRDEERLVELWQRFRDEKKFTDPFKYGPVEQVAILVVVDKYLTGFDAPVEQALYLDKRLQDHGLLQAIARVNRTHTTPAGVEKTYGLVVDYWGIAEKLDRALAVFAKEDVDPVSVWSRRDGEDAYQSLKQRRHEVFALFDRRLRVGQELDEWVEYLAPEDARAAFDKASRSFAQALDQLLPDPRGLDFLVDAKWLEDIRRKARRDFYAEDLAVTAASVKVRQLIDRHVQVRDVVQILEPVPVLSARFVEEVERLRSLGAKAERLLHALEAHATEHLAEDPATYETLRQRLRRLIDERRAARLGEVEAYQRLLAEREKLLAAQQPGDEFAGRAPNVRPLVGVLERELDSPDDGPAADRARLIELAEQLLAALEEETVLDWTRKEDVQRTMRRHVKRLLRASGVAEDRVEPATAAVMELARHRLARR